MGSFTSVVHKDHNVLFVKGFAGTKCGMLSLEYMQDFSNVFGTLEIQKSAVENLQLSGGP